MRRLFDVKQICDHRSGKSQILIRHKVVRTCAKLSACLKEICEIRHIGDTYILLWLFSPGLPAHHAESVRAIRRGMPLFLFNYSSRCLCGVFEVFIA